MGMTFSRWLQCHIAEDTTTGDLARTARFAQIRARTRSAWEAQLRAQGASWDVLRLLDEAWEQYRAGSAPPEPGKPPVERGDDRWTITRPPLPNWVGSPPPLLWVRRDVLSESAPAVRVACGEVFMAAVEQQGRYFQREFGYDFLPYTAREHVESGDDQMGAYLMFDYKEFATATMRPIGACSFRYTPKDLCWVLGWVWLHPFARRRGHLRAAWPTFRRQYGAFVVERPLSDAMAAFLRHVEPAGAGT